MTEIFHHLSMQALSKSNDTISLKFDAISEIVNIDKDIKNLITKVDLTRKN